MYTMNHSQETINTSRQGNYHDNVIVFEAACAHWRTGESVLAMEALLNLKQHILDVDETKSRLWIVPAINILLQNIDANTS